MRVDGHMGVASRAALRFANITESTVDPPGGAILRTAQRQPTGVLQVPNPTLSAVLWCRESQGWSGVACARQVVLTLVFLAGLAGRGDEPDGVDGSCAFAGEAEARTGVGVRGAPLPRHHRCARHG